MTGDTFSLEVVLSETPAAELLPAATRELVSRAVRETLISESTRLAEIVAHHRPSVEVSLTLTDDSGIRDLNRRYLNRDSATDVLSFFMGEAVGDAVDHALGHAVGGEGDGEGGPEDAEPFLLGDIVVSLETVRAQAIDWERPFDEELARVVCHGALHLLGCTDESDEAATAMRIKEDAVLTVLGFSPRLP